MVLRFSKNHSPCFLLASDDRDNKQSTVGADKVGVEDAVQRWESSISLQQDTNKTHPAHAVLGLHRLAHVESSPLQLSA